MVNSMGAKWSGTKSLPISMPTVESTCFYSDFSIFKQYMPRHLREQSLILMHQSAHKSFHCSEHRLAVAAAEQICACRDGGFQSCCAGGVAHGGQLGHHHLQVARCTPQGSPLVGFTWCVYFNSLLMLVP